MVRIRDGGSLGDQLVRGRPCLPPNGAAEGLVLTRPSAAATGSLRSGSNRLERDAMSDLIARLKNRLWRLKSEQTPEFGDFHSPMREEFRRQYTGKSADIFFSNEGDVAHKWLHYLPIYDELFQSRAGTGLRFLEIGVSKGGSLQVWREYFGEDAIIFGVDINPNCASFNGRYGQVRIGSQDDPGFLRSVVREMGGVDIVLDDGSHISRHQQASFETLFPLLSEDGLYVIEDMHTAYWPSYEGGRGRRGTAVEFLKEKVDEMHRHYQARGLNRAELMTDIKSVQFFDSIAAVRKCRQLPRRHVMMPS